MSRPTSGAYAVPLSHLSLMTLAVLAPAWAFMGALQGTIVLRSLDLAPGVYALIGEVLLSAVALAATAYMLVWAHGELVRIARGERDLTALFHRSTYHAVTLSLPFMGTIAIALALTHLGYHGAALATLAVTFSPFAIFPALRRLCSQAVAA